MRNLILFMAFSLIVASPLILAGGKGVGGGPQAEVDHVLAKYRKADAVQAKIKKKVTQVFGVENESEGDFYFSKGKLRMDFTKPEKTTLVYDGKVIWMEAHLDENTVQVTKVRANDLKRSNSVLTALFEKKNVLRDFKLIKSETAGDQKTYTFEPRKKSKEQDVVQLSVTLAKQDISSISYKDQVENVVRFDFSNIQRGPVTKGKFSYTPPKNAEVTVL